MVKLIIAAFLCALSLLVIIPAPHLIFWKLSVGLTSYPILPMALSFVLLVVAYFNNMYKIPTALLASTALIIFSLPIIKAVQLNSKLHTELQKSFPIKVVQNMQKPFQFLNMFKANKAVPYHTHIYKNNSLQNLTFDFYAAATNKTTAPLIIIIHGGSWQSGNSRQLPELNSALALQGYHVAAINYSLAPAYKAPTAEYDTEDAINYFIKNYKLYKVNTNKIILLGRSAGAQIALCAAYKFKIPNIKGVINFYGPADMVWAGKLAPNAGVLDNNTIYNNYLGGLYSQLPAKFEEATALLQAHAQAPPTLTIHGQIDPLVFKTHAEHLHKKLNELAVPNYYLKLYNATHGCDYNLQSPAGQLSTYAVLHFLHFVCKQ